uniref:Mucolipin-3-like n=1 Tax=Gouania willdenowi TaxID=441366 RepID=A0A8C5GKV5_GOUWI
MSDSGSSSEMEDVSSIYDPFSTCDHPAHASDHQQEKEEDEEEDDQNKVEFLRRKIKYFFMNPCEKYHARGRKPWKLILQIVKIGIITIQLVLFGLSNQMVVTFKEQSLTTFRHLFLKDYVDGGMDTYAVYRQADVYDHIYYIIEQFELLHNITVGNHAYDKDDAGISTPLMLCQEFYRNGTIYPGNETFDIDIHVENKCLEVFPMVNSEAPLLELYFKRMLSVKITFVLKSINLQTVRHRELPDCYDFFIAITFNNEAHSGRIKVDLENDVDINECKEWKVSGVIAKNINLTVLFDCVIIITCLTSFTLCVRSVIKGLQLLNEYTEYRSKHCSQDMSWSEQSEFINSWYILIIISDTLTIIGSILKIEIQTKILILTLRAAFPNVIRFICCAGIIYVSYCFCGWIVIGPYHEKFRTLNTVSECLFSLINGDDMYPTFKNIKQKSSLVWYFSRVYLYSFVSLFIYMILSLFITIITDTYDTIKQQRQSGLPTTELVKFLSACNDLPNSGLYRLDESSDCFSDCWSNRCRRHGERLTSEA